MPPSVLRVVAFVIGVVSVSGVAHMLFVRWICTFAPRLREHRKKLWVVGGILVFLPLVARWTARTFSSSLLLGLQAAVASEQMIVVLGALPLLLFMGGSSLVGAVVRRVRPKGEGAKGEGAKAEDAKGEEPAAAEESEGAKGEEPAAAEESEGAKGEGAAKEREPSPRLTRRDAVFRIAGAAAWGTTGAVLGWGLVRGRHSFVIEEVVVRIARLPRALDGYTLAQVSDVHCGPFVGERELGEMSEAVRRIKPDLVVATGDLVDFDAARAPELAAALVALPSRDGHLAILGNHDYYAGAGQVRAHLERAGVDVLVNQTRVIRPRDGGGIALVGVDDMWARPDLDVALSRVGADAAKVLLAHQPRYLDVAAGRVDLQLSGHTHGGQVNPGFRPADLLMKYVSGRYERSGTVLWVNRGVGVAAVPSRVAAPPEVTKIVLVAG
ncbi:MAG: metallophosphoesterase [Myxococcales bacterium]|nr:metallophosphoesterase [Myxococcales bacterium]